MTIPALYRATVLLDRYFISLIHFLLEVIFKVIQKLMTGNDIIVKTYVNENIKRCSQSCTFLSKREGKQGMEPGCSALHAGRKDTEEV
jgi:hypothetical protein